MFFFFAILEVYNLCLITINPEFISFYIKKITKNMYYTKLYFKDLTCNKCNPASANDKIEPKSYKHLNI